MQRERFTRKEFDNSRFLLGSFVSAFHFRLFEVLEEIDDLRCIVKEDDDTGDLFYCFIKHYGEYSQRVVSSEMSLSAVENFIFEEFQWSIIDYNFRSRVSLSFQFNDYFNVLSLSMAESVSLLLGYVERDFEAFENFNIHPMSNIFLLFPGEYDDFSPYSLEEFEQLQPTLFCFLRKNGLL